MLALTRLLKPKPEEVIAPDHEESNLRRARAEAAASDPAGEDHVEASLALGRFLRNWHRRGEAAAVYQDLLAILERGSERSWMEVASALAATYAESGELSEAERLIQKALDRGRRRGDSTSEVGLELLHNKAALHHLRQQHHEAKQLYEEVLTQRVEILGEDHPATVITCVNLGQLLMDQGDFAQAEERLQQAVALLGDGETWPDEAATAHSMLAELYARREEWEGARHEAELALRIARAHLNERDPRVGRLVSRLGAIEHSAGGDLDEAENLLRQALKIQAPVLNPPSSELADTLEGLGAVLYAQGRPGREGEVIDILERSLAARPRADGRQTVDCVPALSRLAWLHTAVDEVERAEKTWEDVLALLRRLGELEDERMKDALEAYSNWLDHLGRETEALEVRTEAGRLTGGRSRS